MPVMLVNSGVFRGELRPKRSAPDMDDDHRPGTFTFDVYLAGANVKKTSGGEVRVEIFRF